MSEISSANGEGLLLFLQWTIDKGELNSSTARALKGASAAVMEASGPAHEVDVRAVDLDGLETRFRNKKQSKYKAQSLNTYIVRFKTAVSMYVAWLDGKSDWRNVGRGISKADSKTTSKATVRSDQTVAKESTESRISTSSQIEYPFPIRPNVRARLWIPEDITKAEVERLVAFVRALAVDQDEFIYMPKSEQVEPGQ